MSTERLTGTVTPKQNVTGQLARAEHIGGTRNYPDLLNKPSIEGVELVGNKTLAELNIGAYLRDYTSESQVIAIVNTAIGQIAIPVNTSDLVNDSDFQTGDDVIDAIADAVSGLAIPANTSDLVNDSNYQTGADVDDAIDKALEDLSIPTKTSELTNDSGFQTSSDVDTAIDTALEGLNIPTKTSDLSNDSGFQTAADVQDAIAEVDIPTRLSDLTNDMTFQTLTQITNLINDAIGSAVGLNFEVVQTLPATGEGGTIYLVPNGGSALIKNVYDEYIWYNGQWEKIGDTTIDLTGYVKFTDIDSTLSTTSENPVQNKVVKAALDDKVSKVTGKSLSTNDYTNADKAIVDGVTAALAGKADISSIPTKTSDLTNDSNFVSDANYVHTDNNYDATAKGIVDGVTAALAGKADAADIPTALADLTDDATHRLVTDTDKAAWNGKADIADIPTALADLTDDTTHRLVTDTEKSTWNAKADSADIPTKTSDLDNDSGFVTAEDLEDKQDIFQLDTVPTASVDYVGDIIQYVGATTASYTNGYFYKCKKNISEAIHILGGTGNVVAKTSHYNLNGSTWVSVSTLSEDVNYSSAVIFNNEIHVFNGGRNDHLKWNGSEWVIASQLPYSPYKSAVVVFNGEIHMLGGSESQGNGLKHYKWDGSNWSSLSTLPYGFQGGSAVVYNGEIHLISGNGSNAFNHYKWNGSTWSSVSTLPFFGAYAIVYNNAIHIFGGRTTDHYKWNGSTWSSVSTTPYSFYNGSLTIYNNEIHLLGGDNGNELKHYKWNDSEWLSDVALPYNFCEGSAVVYTGTGVTYSWDRVDVQPSSSSGSYVQKSGDTMTGDLTVPNLIATSEVTDGKGNTLSGVNGNLAPIESTSTASKSYSVGDYLVFQGQLYRVTSPIQSGGTIIPITNITATTVTDEIGVSMNISDSTSASAIGTSANITTERDIYYGLPNINSDHTYNSNSNFYAPTSAGTNGQVLTSNGSGAPSWQDPSGGSDPIYINVTTNAATPVAASANVNNSVAIGYGSNAINANSVAIGYNCKKASAGASIGTNINAYGPFSGGNDIYMDASPGSIAIGSYVNSTNNSGQSILIGLSVRANNNSGDSILIGNYGSANNSEHVVGIGYSGIANNSKNSTSIGCYQNAINSEGSISLGYQSTVNSSKYGIMIGTRAGTMQAYLSNAPESIAIGRSAQVINSNNSIALGSASSVSAANNTIQLGNTNIASLKCKVQLTVTSDIRDKTDIEPIPNAIDFLKEIEPITYVSNMRDWYNYSFVEEIQNEDGRTEIIDNNPYKEYGFTPYDKEEHAKGTKKGERRRSGVSAQNVRDAMIKIYGTDNYANLINDDMYDRENVPEEVESHLGVQYECFVPFLIKAIQELDVRLSAMEERLQ